jgi:Bacterial Ig-like domain (group 3)/Right handed beta helix region
MRTCFHRPLARKNKKTFRPALEPLECRTLPSTYYVANNNPKMDSDSNNGSQTSPWLTIQHAANEVQAGDTVIIEGGTYAGFDVQTSGTSTAPITFEAAPGAQVIIDSPEANRGDCGINIEDFDNGSSVNYITIEGLDIANPTNGAIMMGIRAVWNGDINSTGIQLIDNTITGCGEFGILTGHEDNLLIEGNSVSGTLGTGSQGHGIYVSNACFDPHVIGNTIFDNESLGLHMNGDASEGAAIEPDGTDDGNAGNIIGAVVEDNVIYDNGLNGINCDGVQHSVFENNLLYNNGGGIVLYVEDAAAPAIDNVIANNTITVLATDNFGNEGRWDIQIMDGTPEDGALPDAGSTGNIVFNNILINQESYHGSIEIGPLSLSGFYSNNNVITTSGDSGSASSHAFDLEDSSGDDNFVSLATWQSDTGQDTNSITADSAQLFVNPSWSSSSGNYQLLSTSPAVGAGLESFQTPTTSVSAPATDILGNPRSSPYDIGAYEYESAVGQAATTTTLSSSAATAQAGQSVTFTATVSSSTAGSITGTVTFMDGATTLGTGTVNSNGQATFTTSALAVGSHSITAVYGGNTSYDGSTSSALSQTIDQATSTTSVSTSAATITYGQSVTFTATVTSSTGIAATGTVTFMDGSTTLGTGTLNSSGQATFSTKSLSVGAQSISAVYSGDTNNAGSTSSTLTETVNPLGSTTTLTTSAASRVYGQSLTLTATVASSTGTAVTGTVTFMDGSTVLGSGTLSAGKASFSTSTLAAGSHSLTAVYGGDSTVGGSTSAAKPVTVSQASTTTARTASATSITVLHSVTFTATVHSTTTGTPTGTVTFMDGTTTLGSAPLVGGKATFATSALPVGTNDIKVVYGGDSNFKASTSTAVAVTVVKATTSTKVVSSAASVAPGVLVTFTATVSSSTSGPLTGTVTFKSGTTILGTAPLSGGTATFSIWSLAVGSHKITAVFGGDSDFAGSTSPAITEIVT